LNYKASYFHTTAVKRWLHTSWFTCRQHYWTLFHKSHC